MFDDKLLKKNSHGGMTIKHDKMSFVDRIQNKQLSTK